MEASRTAKGTGRLCPRGRTGPLENWSFLKRLSAAGLGPDSWRGSGHLKPVEATRAQDPARSQSHTFCCVERVVLGAASGPAPRVSFPVERVKSS